MKKILITDHVHPSLISRLKMDGYEVDHQTDISPQTVKEVIDRYYGIVINSKITMTPELIDQGKQLEFIARLGSGMEIVDIPYARSKGIRVINAPEGNCNAVGEHVIGMLLALSNHLIRCNKEVKNFHWNREKNRGFELKGKTIGIIGVGHTGRSLAIKLQGWGMKVLGYDKYKEGYGKEMGYIQETNLKKIQDEADIISFHLPLSEETFHLCDAAFIDQCKDGVILVNTSRGVIIQTRDLLHALIDGKVGGACLDVFENEKPSSFTGQEAGMYRRLYDFENVVVSPHVAGWTEESLQGIADVVYARISNNYSMEAEAWRT